MNTGLSVGKNLLHYIKESSGLNKTNFVIPVGKPVRAYLRVIPTLPSQHDPLDLQLLSDWRNKYVKSFLTEFRAYPERTAKWLSEYVHKNEGKILFMLVTLDGERLGHIGLAFIDWDTGYGEADAIVSGGASPYGLMKLALQTTLKWAKEQLSLISLGVRVRSDNTALDFYRKVGFQEVKRVPLRIEKVGDDTNWYEDEGLVEFDAALVYMIYRSE
ncbi:GNAT family N-acetyltransferase [Undibacterium sp. Dicai25W]|uniref:GNAT family N-acetyltransferase n=1 Tax=Undibacterium sp. Dicai25W TaxID=3413034 RepID=UPI003BF28C7E